MTISFKEELIRVEFVIGEDVVREAVTGIIDVPEPKPDVERVLEVAAVPRTVSARIVEAGVELTGELAASIIYVADVVDPYEPQQSVHFLEGILQFTNFVEIPGTRPGMNVVTDVDVIRTSFRLIGPRQIEVTVVIRKFVKVTEFRQIKVITGVKGVPTELIREELLRIEHIVGENILRSIVEGRIIIPEEKPPAERIVRSGADVIEVSTSITEDGVVVSGTIEGNVVYVGDVPNGTQPIHFVSGTFPFERVITVPGARPGMNVFPVVRVVRVSARLVNDRTIELSVLLEIFVKVTQPRQVLVVIDIKSSDVDIKKELLRVEDVIGEKVIREVMTRRVEVPENKPSLVRILEARASVVEATPTVEENGVTIVGELELNILYVAEAPPGELQQPVHFLSTRIPFENFVPVPGAEPGFQAHIRVTVRRVGTRIINSRTIEVDVVIEKFAKVTEFRQLEIIVDLVVISPIIKEPCPPSFVVYVVQPGDTLFKIARRFQTTVEKLVAVNKIKDPDRIDVGQKICVPKKIIKPKG